MFLGPMKAQIFTQCNSFCFSIQLRSIYNNKIVLGISAHAITATSKEKHASWTPEEPATCVSKQSYKPSPSPKLYLHKQPFGSSILTKVLIHLDSCFFPPEVSGVKQRECCPKSCFHTMGKRYRLYVSSFSKAYNITGLGK